MSEQLINRMLSGDRQALARLFSVLERDPAQAPRLMRKLHRHTGRAYCIGITGPPGAGKSTLVDGLIQRLRGEARSVGVLAVDPTSPFGGGALLGDRIRMKEHFLDEGVFIRSVATRGAHGGLFSLAGAAVRLLDAYGLEVVLVESVGVGQTELEVMNVADTVVVMLVPEGGDTVQAMKSGLMEIGDIFVVNKADRSGAGQMASTVKSEVWTNAKGRWWTPPVLLTQAHKGEGIDALHQEMARHRQESEEGSHLQSRRSQRHRLEFARAIGESIESRVVEMATDSKEFGALVTQVERGEVNPYWAANEALDGDRLFSRLAELFQSPPPQA